jgi:23S rRNA (adenine2503-C2)-methyltransferase
LTDLPSILDISRDDLAEAVAAWGEPAYRASQIWQAVYRQFSPSAEGITGLPKALRHRLDETFAFRQLEVRGEARSSDGQTVKVALARPGEARAIEAVRMGYRRRTTLCISTQAGCAMGCTFCATGQMGFARQLSAGEIVEQVLVFAARELISNIVFMGMGEPFHNYEATLEAVDRLNDSEGMAFGARRMTLSTVGLVPQIERFTRERRQVNLAVSLHAATDDLRDRLVPINRKYSLDALMEACRAYIQMTGRRLTFEWALIRDINDGEDQASALASRVRGLNCHVNLIPLNPTSGYPGEASPRERAAAFRNVLTSRGIPCTVRVRRGLDIDAGCGQLAAKSGGERSAVRR